MKNDVVLASLINFLLPLILLYALFSLVEYINNGFSSVIYSTVLVIIAFIIYSVKFSAAKPAALIGSRLISWLGFSISVIYLIMVLLFLIDLTPQIRV